VWAADFKTPCLCWKPTSKLRQTIPSRAFNGAAIRKAGPPAGWRQFRHRSRQRGGQTSSLWSRISNLNWKPTKRRCHCRQSTNATARVHLSAIPGYRSIKSSGTAAAAFDAPHLRRSKGALRTNQEVPERFPVHVRCLISKSSIPNRDEPSEERRLRYVAMMRAKDDLHLIVPQRSSRMARTRREIGMFTPQGRA